MTTLGEYIKVQGGYAYKSKDFIESSDNKVLKIKNVRFGTIDYSEPAYVSNEIAEATKNWKVKEGDVLISMTGSGPNAPQSLVGRVARVWKNEPDAWINQRVGRVCLLDEAPVYLDFIFYWLSLPQSQDYLVSNSSGSANQANISGKIIESLPCPKVDYQISKQIADLARKFDEKIILNSQTNQTLEEMAQAIFKSWFVDFDPVKAKMNGELPEGMDAATASLFPEKLVESELGLIPDGWELTNIGKVSECFDKKRIPLSKRQRDQKQGSIPYYGATSVMDYVDEAIFDDIYLLIGEDGSVMKDDGTPFIQYIWGPAWVNNHAHVLQGIKSVSTEQLMLFFQQTNINAYVTGAVQLKINQRNMNSIPFIKAPKEINERFYDVVAPLYVKTRAIKEENEQLAKLRDTLLPKLLSGEINLDTTEELVEVN